MLLSFFDINSAAGLIGYGIIALIVLVFLGAVFIYLQKKNNVENSQKNTPFGPVYSLRTNGASYAHDNINTALLCGILNDLNADEWDFITLSTDEPINGCTFIQVGAPLSEAEFSFTLEMGFCDEEGRITLYRRYTKNKDLIIRYLIDYVEFQRVPNLNGWNDISHEMRQGA